VTSFWGSTRVGKEERLLEKKNPRVEKKRKTGEKTFLKKVMNRENVNSQITSSREEGRGTNIIW